MRSPILPADGGSAFFKRALAHDFSMEETFFDPLVGEKVSEELHENGMLHDYNEENPTHLLYSYGMENAQLLHRNINGAISRVIGRKGNYLPSFSVRVFQEAEIGTTVHRNHFSIGPWVVGLTLKGSAPFNVYTQDQLPDYEILPLTGSDDDPTPFQSMDARAGAAWSLYTRNNQTPHSSGLVTDGSRRELLIFYASTW